MMLRLDFKNQLAEPSSKKNDDGVLVTVSPELRLAFVFRTVHSGTAKTLAFRERSD